MIPKARQSSKGMKNRLLLLAAVSLLAAGCSKNGPADMRVVRITASAETSPDSRSQIGEISSGELFMEWSVGDRIGVFGGSASNAVMANTATVPSYQAVFQGEIGLSDVPAYAYYPYDETVTDISSVPVSIPQDQEYVNVTSVSEYDVKASVSISQTSENEYVMRLRQMASMLRFEVDIDEVEGISPDEKVMSITLESTGDPITGEWLYSLTDLDAGLRMASGTSASNALNLTFYHTPEVTDIITAYAVVAPGSHKDRDFSISIRTDRHEISFVTRSLSDFNAGKFLTFPLNASVLQNNDAVVTQL